MLVTLTITLMQNAIHKKNKNGFSVVTYMYQKNNYKTIRNEKNIIYISKNGFNNSIIENAIHWEKKKWVQYCYLIQTDVIMTQVPCQPCRGVKWVHCCYRLITLVEFLDGLVVTFGLG